MLRPFHIAVLLLMLVVVSRHPRCERRFTKYQEKEGKGEGEKKRERERERERERGISRHSGYRNLLSERIATALVDGIK